MASAEPSGGGGGGDHTVELIARDVSASEADAVGVLEEIAPLLTQVEKPKINIFTISYPRRKPGVQSPIQCF